MKALIRFVILYSLFALSPARATPPDTPSIFKAIIIPFLKIQSKDASTTICALFREASKSAEKVGEVTILVLDSEDSPNRFSLEIKNETLENCIQKLCAQHHWKHHYTESALVMGPKVSVERFKRIWTRKPPHAMERRPIVLNKVMFSHATAADVSMFLNERVAVLAGKQLIDLKPNPKVRGTVLLFGQGLFVPEVIWLVSAALGGTPIEIFGNNAIPQ